MRYVFAGKSETYFQYIIDNNLSSYNICEKEIFFVNIEENAKIMEKNINNNDIIVLLHGWFAKEWTFKILKDVKKKFPFIQFEYNDGHFGEKEREKLFKKEKNDFKSDTIYDRFDILDI